MANDRIENQCAHPSCDCPAPQGEDYCSPHCESAPDAEINCGCGHPACVAGKADVARV